MDIIFEPDPRLFNRSGGRLVFGDLAETGQILQGPVSRRRQHPVPLRVPQCKNDGADQDEQESGSIEGVCGEISGGGGAVVWD